MPARLSPREATETSRALGGVGARSFGVSAESRGDGGERLFPEGTPTEVSGSAFADEPRGLGGAGVAESADAARGEAGGGGVSSDARADGARERVPDPDPDPPLKEVEKSANSPSSLRLLRRRARTPPPGEEDGARRAEIAAARSRRAARRGADRDVHLLGGGRRRGGDELEPLERPGAVTYRVLRPRLRLVRGLVPFRRLGRRGEPRPLGRIGTSRVPPNRRERLFFFAPIVGVVGAGRRLARGVARRVQVPADRRQDQRRAPAPRVLAAHVRRGGRRDERLPRRHRRHRGAGGGGGRQTRRRGAHDEREASASERRRHRRRRRLGGLGCGHARAGVRLQDPAAVRAPPRGDARVEHRLEARTLVDRVACFSPRRRESGCFFAGKTLRFFGREKLREFRFEAERLGVGVVVVVRQTPSFLTVERGLCQQGERARERVADRVRPGGGLAREASAQRRGGRRERRASQTRVDVL